MSDIEEANRDVVEAARQGEQFAMMLAAVQAAQQTQQLAPCQHHQAPAPASSFDAKKAVTYTVCGCVGAAFLALFFVAFAIGAISVAICALVLWRLWNGASPKR